MVNSFNGETIYYFLETNYFRSARSDAFLRSIGAQALRGGLAKNYFLQHPSLT